MLELIFEVIEEKTKKAWMIIFHQELKMLFLSARKKHLRLGHDYIGTEHLMLGILRDGEGKAISILNALRLT